MAELIQISVSLDSVISGRVHDRLCTSQIEASTFLLGIPRAFDAFSCPGGREFDELSLPGGGKTKY